MKNNKKKPIKKDKNQENISLEKRKKETSKVDEPLKFGLISKSSSPWNIWPGFNQEALLSTNSIKNSEDKI